MRALRVATWQETLHYGTRLPKGLLPRMAGGAGAYVAEVGSLAVHAASAVLTDPITPNATIPVGNTLFLVAVTDNSSTVSSVTDTGSNTWTVDRTGAFGTTVNVNICSAPITTQLTNASTVTLHYSGSGSKNRSALVEEFSGILQTAYSDVKASTSGTTASSGNTTIATGTTGTTSQAAEVAICAWGLSASASAYTFTLQSPVLPFTTAAWGYAAGMGAAVGGGYIVLNSTGAESGSVLTSANSAPWGGAVVTYKAVVAAVPASQFFPHRMPLGV